MLNKLKNIFGMGVKTEELRPEPPSEAAPKPKKERKPRKKKEDITDAKELANKNGEPYVAITKVHIDPNDINNGAFELDFNDKFVLNLVKQGYKIKKEDTDNEIVDRWFQTVCRNVALEVYEQEVADPEKRPRTDVRVIQQKDLGNGRTEIS
jgi:TPP-dependent 2-oxoacid decarboxylase